MGHVPVVQDRSGNSHALLARQVFDLAQLRGLKRGDRLPEQVFARACGVSRTPMRAAFKLLSENDFLWHEQGFGYRLAVDPEAGADTLLRRLDRLERPLADRILADRSARRLDDVLSVAALSRRYGVTRGVVSNALFVLQQEGIVARAPGQAWSFRPILDTAAALGESLEFRLILEPEAIRTPGFALDAARARQNRIDTAEALATPPGGLAAAVFHRIDTGFHALIARGASNRFVRDVLLAHHRLRRITQTEIATPEFRLRQALEEHIAILDSLERRQMDVAADRMVLHLRLSRNQRPDAANRGSPPLPPQPDRAAP
ncbi:MAG: GntR family transcriptional regulator [Gemmobacter sp.]